VAEPHFPQANLQFCQSIHGKPWTPPWLNPAGTDLVLPFSHEICVPKQPYSEKKRKKKPGQHWFFSVFPQRKYKKKKLLFALLKNSKGKQKKR
jgi:hypothetical protein